MIAENKNTEYKREFTAEIKKTVAAFANTDGGRVLVGVEDDGTVIGLPEPDSVLLQITNAIRDGVCPDVTLFTDCSPEAVEDKMIVMVNVQRGTHRPYYIAGKGVRPEGVFVRQGASTVPASEAAILKMIRETSGDCYEEARSLKQSLSFEKTAAIFKEKGISLEEPQKKTLGLIGEDGTYTNLALLLSDQCTHTIRLAAFEGALKTVFKDRLELGGSLLAQMQDAYDYIDRFNKRRAEYAGLERVDIRDYPPEAIREALLNALVHREYAFSASTLISIFDDRIEFVSIGGLVKGITKDDIMLGVSMLRNQRLADIFYRLKLIEAYGTGLVKIQNAYAESESKPVIEVTENAFKILLPNINYKTESAEQSLKSYAELMTLSERETAALKLIKENNGIVRLALQKALGVSSSTTGLLLRKLTEAGLVVKERVGKEVKYYIN